MTHRRLPGSLRPDHRTRLTPLSAFLVGALLLAAPWVAGPVFAQSQACYVCAGQPNTFVKFEGKDNFERRQKAAACGCQVTATATTCDAANFKILCTLK